MKIRKTDFFQWLDGVAKEYQIIAPVNTEDGVVFKQIKATQEINAAYFNSKLPPKAVFFPQYEKLLSYKIDGKNIEVKANIDATRRILFGIRPCDAKSMLLLDKVFENDLYRDPYYCNRREQTVVIGLGCNKTATTCFCSSVGLSPADNTASDIFLLDLGEEYYLEIVTPKGKQLAQSLPNLTELTQEDDNKVDQIRALATQSEIAVSTASARLETMFDNDYWDALHEKCIGCNTCSFVCPTCHCFDMKEETSKNEGARVRTWDTCMAPLFTIHGSGHNPRDKKKARWRQRLLHKFSYFLKNYGDVACVGCGRCIRNCPVNFDIRQAIDGVSKVEVVG